MKSARRRRLQIQDLKGNWRFIFCKSGNSSSKETGSSVIPTDDKKKALYSDGDNLAYFTRHANGRPVREEPGTRKEPKGKGPLDPLKI